jgi:hypothetical protein
LGALLAVEKLVFRRDCFIKRFPLVYFKKQHCHGSVKHLGEFGSTFDIASIKETKLPSRRQAFSGQKVQVALRSASPRQTVLQTEVLRDKITPVHPNDARAFLLHATVPVLLESAERRPANQMG